jgi:hypothetical protein
MYCERHLLFPGIFLTIIIIKKQLFWSTTAEAFTEPAVLSLFSRKMPGLEELRKKGEKKTENNWSCVNYDIT